MKKFLAVLLAALMVLSCVACGESTTETTAAAAGEETTAAEAAAGEETTAAAATATYDGKLAQPAVVTAIGQADIDLAKQILTKAGVQYDENATLTDADISAYKTIFMVVGASKKGLGAAGVDAAGETSRGEAICTKAKAAGIPVVAMHLGGKDRRGGSSDDIIQAIVKQADWVIVAGTGDEDGAITGWAAGIPVSTVDTTKDVVGLIQGVLE